jgi:hypothetical protein
MRIYRQHFSNRSLPVTFHLDRPWRVQWTHIYGIEIGGWFIGAVRSKQAVAKDGGGTEPDDDPHALGAGEQKPLTDLLPRHTEPGPD